MKRLHLTYSRRSNQKEFLDFTTYLRSSQIIVATAIELRLQYLRKKLLQQKFKQLKHTQHVDGANN
jgi:hypothetical protein